MRAGVLAAGRPSARPIDDPRRHRLAPDRHARPRPRRALGAGRATSCRARRSAARWPSCARSCSSASTWGPRRRASTRRSSGVVASLFEHYCAHPEEIPELDPGRRAAAPRDRLHRRHDRPLLHPHVRGAERAGGVRAVSRYTADSRDRVRDAVDMLALVSDAHRAAPRRRRPATSASARSTTSAPRRSASTPIEKVYHCFGCQASGDAFTFVMETEGLDFTGALESLADRFGVELETEREDPEAARTPPAPRAAALAARAGRHLLRALPVGGARGRARPRISARAAACARRRCASSASATRRARGTGC